MRMVRGNDDSPIGNFSRDKYKYLTGEELKRCNNGRVEARREEMALEWMFTRERIAFRGMVGTQ